MKNYHDYQSCIEACLKCAALCNHCASECLTEEEVKMMDKCIQYDMECAAVCYAAAQLMSLGSDKAKDFCFFFAEMCERCYQECIQHDMKHCQECAEACKKCAELCRQIAA